MLENCDGRVAIPDTHQPLKSEEKELAPENMLSMLVAADTFQFDKSVEKLVAPSKVFLKLPTFETFQPEMSLSNTGFELNM